MSPTDYEYDLAFSYADDHQEYVSQVASEARRLGLRVFYDRDPAARARALGKDLPFYLRDVFLNKSRYSVAFISRTYTEKQWPQFEWRTIQARDAQERGEYVLPARFDDTVVPELLPSTVYADLRKETPLGFARLLFERVLLRDQTSWEPDTRLASLFDRAVALLKMQRELKRDVVEANELNLAPPFGRRAVLRCFDADGRLDVLHLFALAEPPDEAVVRSVAAIVQDVTTEEDPRPTIYLVYAGPPVDESIMHFARRNNVILKTLIELQGLIDFRGFVQRQTKTLLEDEEYPPGGYVSQGLEWTHYGRIPAGSDAIRALLDALSVDHGRVIVLLGDGGTGKTFTMHELARQMAAENSRAVPVLIEMRKLERKHSLDDLVAIHLGGRVAYEDKSFRQMLEDGRIALLFDGYDELALRATYEDAADYFDVLLAAARGQAKVVVTCRSQHFLNDRQIHERLERSLQNVLSYRIARLVPFDEAQIEEFLRHRLGSKRAAQRRHRLLKELKELHEIGTNPRMLGFLAGISEEELRRATKEGGLCNASDLYEFVINEWLDREVSRVKEIRVDLTREDLRSAMTDLAVVLWNNAARSVSLEDQPDWLGDVWSGLALPGRNAQQAQHQCLAGGLLVREGEGTFRFVHDSFIEHLVGRAAAQDLMSLERREMKVLDCCRTLSRLMSGSFLGSVLSEFDLERHMRAFLDGDGAMDMLRLCSFLGNAPVRRSTLLEPGFSLLPESLRNLISDEAGLRDIGSAFQAARLGKGDETAVQIYPLIGALVRERLSPQESTFWRSLALSVVSEAYPNSAREPEDLERARDLEPHAVAVTDPERHSGRCHESAELLDRVGWTAFRAGDEMRATAAFASALEIGAEEEVDILTGVRRNNLAAARISSGDVTGAIASLTLAKAGNQSSFHQNHRHHARVYANLGQALAESGRIDDGIEALQQALRLLRTERLPSAVPILDGLGALLKDLGAYSVSLQALEAARRSDDSDKGHAMQAVRACLLSQLYELSGDEASARAERQTSSGIWDQMRRRFAKEEAVHIVSALSSLESGFSLASSIESQLPAIRKLADELTALLNESQAELNDAKREAQALQTEQATVLRLGGDAEFSRSASATEQEWSDIEGRIDIQTKKTNELDEKTRNLKRARDEWRAVAEALGFRWSLQMPPCGLCREGTCRVLSVSS